MSPKLSEIERSVLPVQANGRDEPFEFQTLKQRILST